MHTTSCLRHDLRKLSKTTNVKKGITIY